MTTAKVDRDVFGEFPSAVCVLLYFVVLLYILKTGTSVLCYIKLCGELTFEKCHQPFVFIMLFFVLPLTIAIIMDGYGEMQVCAFICDMTIYIQIYLYAYICTYIYMYIHMYIYMHICISCIYIYICIHIGIYVYTYMCTHISCI